MNLLDSTTTAATGPFISYGLNQQGIALVKKVGYVPVPFPERAGILALIGREPPNIIDPTPAPQLPPSIIIDPFLPTPTVSVPREPCGLLNLSIFCPFTFCGIFGRLIGLCN